METATREPTTPAAERRRAPRRQPTIGTVLDLDGGPGHEPRQGLVWNISTSGVSVLLPEPLDPGATFAGELTTTEAGGRLPVRLRVAHVRQLRTGDYFLGAQFERPLGPDEIRPFVAGG